MKERARSTHKYLCLRRHTSSNKTAIYVTYNKISIVNFFLLFSTPVHAAELKYLIKNIDGDMVMEDFTKVKEVEKMGLPMKETKEGKCSTEDFILSSFSPHSTIKKAFMLIPKKIKKN